MLVVDGRITFDSVTEANPAWVRGNYVEAGCGVITKELSSSIGMLGDER